MWWIEWALRNPNADYVKSPALQLGYIAANSIDVIAIITTILLVGVFLSLKLLLVIVRIISNLYLSTTKHEDKKKQKGKKHN